MWAEASVAAELRLLQNVGTLTNELSVETFLQDYIKIRTDCHLQKLKADKIKKL